MNNFRYRSVCVCICVWKNRFLFTSVKIICYYNKAYKMQISEISHEAARETGT